MMHILRAVDGNADWPKNMSTFEVVFAALVYAVAATSLVVGAWMTYVVMWAFFG